MKKKSCIKVFLKKSLKVYNGTYDVGLGFVFSMYVDITLKLMEPDKDLIPRKALTVLSWAR